MGGLSGYKLYSTPFKYVKGEFNWKNYEIIFKINFFIKKIIMKSKSNFFIKYNKPKVS